MMIDKDKTYSLSELLNYYDMNNLEFKFFGNNDKGDLNLYLKTDSEKVSVFKSIKKQSKADYLELDEKKASELEFQFDKEIDANQLEIVAIVLKTSDINIPSGRYTLETLDRETKEQDLEEKERTNDEGIIYMIVDNNTGCPLYDNCYLFGQNKGGLIQNLETELEFEKSPLIKNNLELILDYYYGLTKEKTNSL